MQFWSAIQWGVSKLEKNGKKRKLSFRKKKGKPTGGFKIKINLGKNCYFYYMLNSMRYVATKVPIDIFIIWEVLWCSLITLIRWNAWEITQNITISFKNKSTYQKYIYLMKIFKQYLLKLFDYFHNLRRASTTQFYHFSWTVPFKFSTIMSWIGTVLFIAVLCKIVN